MKKTIFILFMTISTLVNSQCASNSGLTMYDINEDTVYIGDSAWVDIGYGYTIPGAWNKCRAYISIFCSTCSQSPYVNTCTYAHLDSVPRISIAYLNNGADSATRICFIIPSNVDLGENNYVFNTGGFFGDSPEKFRVYIKKRPLAGINQIKFEESKEIKEIKYYNLIGQLIQKPESGFCITDILYSDYSRQRTARFIE